MELPQLPKKHQRKEAKIDSLVAKWFLDNYPDDVAIEVKIKGNKLLPHQEVALNQVNKGEFAYKIPDMGRKNPFDCVVLKKAKAFVVTCDGSLCEAKGLHGDYFIFKI